MSSAGWKIGVRSAVAQCPAECLPTGHADLPPLPLGEGWGEGPLTVRQYLCPQHLVTQPAVPIPEPSLAFFLRPENLAPKLQSPLQSAAQCQKTAAGRRGK